MWLGSDLPGHCVHGSCRVLEGFSYCVIFFFTFNEPQGAFAGISGLDPGEGVAGVPFFS